MFDAFLDRLTSEHAQTQATIQRLASEHQAEVNNLLRLEGAIGTARKMIAMANAESSAPPEVRKCSLLASAALAPPAESGESQVPT